MVSDTVANVTENSVLKLDDIAFSKANRDSDYYPDSENSRSDLFDNDGNKGTNEQELNQEEPNNEQKNENNIKQYTQANKKRNVNQRKINKKMKMVGEAYVEFRKP